MTKTPTDWQLPPGVSRALWEYLRDPHIARAYDASIATSPLAQYDEQVLVERWREAGRLVDLGAGTGRLAIRFAGLGFEVTAVDLSAEMLAVLATKAQAAGVDVAGVAANLCDLQPLEDSRFSYALLMFSTLGMIAGTPQRLQALREAHRVLEPGGRLAVHVHSYWYNLFNPHGRTWLLTDFAGWLVRRHAGGDRVMSDRGIPHMSMHAFTRREICRLLRQAGFVVREVLPLNATASGPLAVPHLFAHIRPNGWIILAERPPASRR